MVDSMSSVRKSAGVPVAVIILLATIPISLSQAQDQAPVTLSQAVAAAIAQGPDAQLNANALATAQQQYAQAVASNRLSLDLAGSGTHTPSSSTPGLPITTPAQDSLQAGLDVGAPNVGASVTASHRIFEGTSTTPLDQDTTLGVSGNVTLWDGYGFGPWGRPAASLEQAATTLAGKKLSSRGGMQGIVVSVTKQWFAALQAQSTVTLRQQSLAQQQGALAQVQAQYDNGLASRLSLQQAQVDERTAAQDLAKSQSDLVSAKQSLAVLLGWPLDRPFTLADAVEPAVPGLDPAALVSTAYASRADLAQLQLSIQQATLSLALTRSQASPTVAVNGGLSLTHSWAEGNNRTDWNVGANAKWSLYDSGVLAAQVRQAELSVAALRTQEQQLRQQIASSVQGAAASVSDLAVRLALARSSLDLASSQEQLARTNLEQGVASQLDVLSAVVRTTGAQVALQQAMASLQLGILSLQSSLGTVEVPGKEGTP